MEASSVHLKLSLATATIVFGHVCRRLDVVSRENGESMLALIFGILLPSLLIQVVYLFLYTCLFLSLLYHHHHHHHHHREFCARVMRARACVVASKKRTSKEHDASRRELSCFLDLRRREALNVVCD